MFSLSDFYTNLAGLSVLLSAKGGSLCISQQPIVNMQYGVNQPIDYKSDKQRTSYKSIHDDNDTTLLVEWTFLNMETIWSATIRRRLHNFFFSQHRQFSLYTFHALYDAVWEPPLVNANRFPRVSRASFQTHHFRLSLAKCTQSTHCIRTKNHPPIHTALCFKTKEAAVQTERNPTSSTELLKKTIIWKRSFWKTRLLTTLSIK